MGCKRKRVEDIRFVQGKGNYVDDLKLPGMLYGDFTRSPHAHARIKNIDTSKAKAVPGVLAVLTAADLKPLNLHYMPTLAGDVQAVLAEEKVLYQNQEVAFVIADDRYVAADGADLVEVEYEALPVNVDPFKAMAPDAPVLREDLKGKTDGAHGKRKHHNHVFTWQMGDKDGDRRRVPQGRRHDQGADLLSARASLPARDLPVRRLVRQDQGRADGVGHVPGAARHPHRRLADLEDPRAQDPRDRARHRRRLRQQGRRLFRLHLRDRRLDRDRAAGEVGRGPHREPVDHGVRARLPHDRRDRRHQGRQGDGAARLHHRRPRRVRRLRRPDQVAGRLLQHRHGLVRFPGRARARRRRLHQQGAGRRRLSLLVPRHRGRLLHRARHGHHGAEARHGSGRAPHEEPDPARAVSLHLGARLGIRFRRLSHRPAARRWTRSATRSCAPSRRPSRTRSGAARRAS